MRLGSLLVFVLASACGSAAPEDPCAPFTDRQWGTADDDEALALVPARSGGSYVAGYRRGTLRVSNIGPAGDSQAFVRKLSPSGAIDWETPLDTAQTDIAEALVELPSGG